MKDKTRTKKSIINIVWGIGCQIIFTLLNFALRSIFINKLSTEYLGINGLFSNILSVLSLAELGMGNAIIFTMYKPLKENDKDKINEILNYYEKIYRRIGIIIFILGILLVPFLKYIVNVEETITNLNLYYILFLLNSVSSYFLIAKTSILTADQKDYILKRTRIIFYILKFVLQSIALIIFNSYLYYLISQILVTILNNLTNLIITKKKYPFIKGKSDIADDLKKKVLNSVSSLFLYQLGGVILNNTDNIIISVICGTSIVGLYSNYNMIVTAIEGVITIIFTAALATIGNFNVDSSPEEKHKLFKVLDMISYWIYGFLSIAFLTLTQDFINIWIGDKYLLSYSIVIISVFNFYLRGVLYPILCFRNTTTLFSKTKFIMIIASLINIVLSIVLGKYIGLFGIFVATAISRLVTNIWFEPMILFRDYFNSNVIRYYIKKIIEIIGIIIITVIIMLLLNLINIQNSILEWIIRGIVCTVISNLYFILILFRTQEFKYLKEKLLLKRNN